MSEVSRIDLIDRVPLTEKQQNVYESIMRYQTVNGFAPTIREICKRVGMASTSSVYKGFVSSDDNTSICITGIL